MSVYLIEDDKITPIPSTTFEEKKILERKHLQALLKSRPEVISPGTLIIAEEFGDWEDSQRRIDLLGIDQDANLVVIELKRTEHGGHMELQAIRYAAMISAMTFDKLVSHYDKYLKNNGDTRNARDSLADFLNWNESDDQALGQKIQIVLASAEFSKELTTSVLWLNEQGLDIRCVRMHPYDHDGQVLLDVQTIIPIPEAEEYQVKIREKRQKERAARESTRDFSKYDVTIGDTLYSNQNKRNLMLLIVSAVFNSGGSPQRVAEALPPRKLRAFEGILDAEQVREQLMQEDTGGAVPRFKRFFCDDGQPFQVADKTYILSNQWGLDALDAARELASMFPALKIELTQAETLDA